MKSQWASYLAFVCERCFSGCSLRIGTDYSEIRKPFLNVNDYGSNVIGGFPVNHRRPIITRQEVFYGAGNTNQGFTNPPFRRTSKCKWAPVELPVLPAYPIVLPAETLAPHPTATVLI